MLAPAEIGIGQSDHGGGIGESDIAGEGFIAAEVNPRSVPPEYARRDMVEDQLQKRLRTRERIPRVIGE